jgi:hypothetical protein
VIKSDYFIIKTMENATKTIKKQRFFKGVLLSSKPGQIPWRIQAGSPSTKNNNL